MQPSLYNQAAAATDHIRARISLAPKIAVILGSGLGAFADRVENAAVLLDSEIPHFPAATVPGHSGRLIFGNLNEIPIAVLQGRIHSYEGYSPQQVTFPIRVLKQLGVSTIIVTNAAGGIRADIKQGDLVLISDHINLTGTNPLIGQNEPRWGERFFDMSDAYSARLRKLAKDAARRQGFELAEGVYLGISGPSFETPAEIRAFRALGADLVGMSTVHEVIVARQMRMEVLGISCVTNMAAGIQEEPLNHEEVLETGRRAQERLGALLASVLGQLRS